MTVALTRNVVSAQRAYAVIDEQEADGRGGVADVTTVFLTARECPIGCSMCDLWQNTLTTPTPREAIPAQIEAALARRGRDEIDWLKLYNSGNFFDPSSIPPSDYGAIATRCQSFSRVIVENHPRFGRRRLLRFRDLLAGQLEVAVGLETVQPRWLARLGKQMTRDDFDAYARWLRQQDVDLRVFLIVGVPSISTGEAMRWATLSVRHAAKAGARHISLIPARSGHGWNGAAKRLPSLSIADLAELQQNLLGSSLDGVVLTIDTWDLNAKATTESEKSAMSRVKQMNLSQRVE